MAEALDTDNIAKPWTCRRCGLVLARVEGSEGHLRLVFDSVALPSLIRDAPGFIEVECPRCGEIRKWHKQFDGARKS